MLQKYRRFSITHNKMKGFILFCICLALIPAQVSLAALCNVWQSALFSII